jgi:hypothetical protein
VILRQSGSHRYRLIHGGRDRPRLTQERKVSTPRSGRHDRTATQPATTGGEDMTPPTNRRVAAKKSAAASKPDPGSGSNGRRTPAKIEHPSHEERAAARDGSPPAVATRFAAEFLTTGRADPTHAPRKPGHHTGARARPHRARADGRLARRLLRRRRSGHGDGPATNPELRVAGARVRRRAHEQLRDLRLPRCGGWSLTSTIPTRPIPGPSSGISSGWLGVWRSQARERILRQEVCSASLSSARDDAMPPLPAQRDTYSN